MVGECNTYMIKLIYFPLENNLYQLNKSRMEREKSKHTSDSIPNGIDVADHIVGTPNPGDGLASVAVFKVACATAQRLRERPPRASEVLLDYISQFR